MQIVVPGNPCTTLGDRARLLCHRRMAILRPDAAFVTSIQASPVRTAMGIRYKVPSTFRPHHVVQEPGRIKFAPTALQPLSSQACRAKEVPQPVKRSRSTRFPTFVLTPGVRRGSRSRCQDALSVKVHTGLSCCCECPGEGERGVQVLVYHGQSRLTAMNTPPTPRSW